MQSLAHAVLNWYRTTSPRRFPWQDPRTPYRVWLSEIMLQQTQAATVIPYFESFTQRFPDLPSLAAAPLAEVLAAWSGLGYYARARNLHATALLCVEQHDGRLPQAAAALNALPGIGRSTANAIIAQAWNRRAPILDGNVKRVLARFHAVTGWPGQSAVTRKLWTLSEQETPAENAAEFTQAIMDFGATLCRPRQPACPDCPLRERCQAHRRGLQAELPQPRPRRTLPERHVIWLLLRRDGEIYLQRNALQGVWGGLHCPLDFPDDGALLAWLSDRGLRTAHRPMTRIRHTFSHFRLIADVTLLETAADFIMDDQDGLWLNRSALAAVGLPSPVRKLLETESCVW